jgi:hypothetical protein
LEVFSENVNVFVMTVHIPSVTKMVRNSRGNTMTRLTPSHEALLFSIYYAAIISMEEDDVSYLGSRVPYLTELVQTILTGAFLHRSWPISVLRKLTSVSSFDSGWSTLSQRPTSSTPRT